MNEIINKVSAAIDSGDFIWFAYVFLAGVTLFLFITLKEHHYRIVLKPFNMVKFLIIATIISNLQGCTLMMVFNYPSEEYSTIGQPLVYLFVILIFFYTHAEKDLRPLSKQE